MKDILCFVGVVSVGCFIMIVVVGGCHGIKEIIENYLHRRAYRHRFDSKPTAACYCVDCRRWNPETGECSDHCNSRRMADCWFCCFADPLTKNELDRRNKIMKGSEANGVKS